MFNLLNRIRNFDIRKITPTQIVLGVIAVIIILAILNFFISLANALLPIAVLGLIAYFGYRWLSSRSPAEVKTTMAQQTQTVSRQEAMLEPESDEVVAERRMKIEQIVNPETGFKEPDITRLMAEEEERLRKADEVNDQIMAQIEARRRRLQKGDEN